MVRADAGGRFGDARIGGAGTEVIQTGDDVHVDPAEGIVVVRR